jgi:hypothetical protein
LQNSQCAVKVQSSTVSGSGNTLTLTLPLTFSSSFQGGRTIYTFTADSSGLISGWQNSGTWTVNASATAPVITTTSPLLAATVGSAYSTSLSATGTTPIVWSVASGTLPGGLTLNSSTGLISGTPTGAGTSTFTINASNSVTSNSKIFSLTTNPSPIANQPPTAQVSPNTGSGSGATFTLMASDGNGYSSLTQADLLIGNSGGAAYGCYIDYAPVTKTLSLRDDTDTSWSQATLGSAVVLQNSQCAVKVQSSTVSGSGNTLTLTLPLTFSKSFRGGRTIYTFTADSSGLISGWQNSGTWTVR